MTTLSIPAGQFVTVVDHVPMLDVRERASLSYSNYVLIWVGGFTNSETALFPVRRSAPAKSFEFR